MTVVVNPKSIIAFTKLIGNMKRFSKDGIKEVYEEVIPATVEQMKKDVPVDTGELKGSISGKVRNKTAQIKATADHAEAIEYGTRYIKPQPYYNKNIEKAKRAILKKSQKSIQDAAK